MKASLAGEPIDATNPELFSVTIEANYDEDVTAGSKVYKINKARNDMEIDLKEERDT